MNIDSVSASTEILNSWKEIAAYLNRGIRTAQRWEVALNLPVRRPRGRQRSAVIAMRSEIDEWLRSCPLQETGLTAGNGAPPRAVELITVPNGNGSNRALLLESRTLRAEMVSSRAQMSESIHKLVSTLGRMMDPGSRVE